MRFLLALLLSLLLSSPILAQGLPLTGGTPAADTPSDQTSGAAVDDLVRILQDDTARNALIERLQQAAPEDVAAPEEEVSDLSIARQLAEYTRSVAQGASTTVRGVGQVLDNIQDVFTGGVAVDARVLGDIAINIAILLVGLFGTFFVLRIGTNALSQRMANSAAEAGWLRRFLTLVSVIVLDAVSIILAWALGYLIALNTGTTPSGQIGINQTLLLNAFLVVEATKLALRIVLMPRFHQLRLLRVSDDNAAYWSFWSARVISLIGYGFMFVAPMVAGLVSSAAGGAVQVITMVTAVVTGIVIILQNKNDVRAWLTELSARRGNAGLWRLLVVLGQSWHLLAIGYLFAVLVAWFANPNGALPFMLRATVQSVIIIAIGSLIVGFIGRFMSTGLTVPQDVRQRLPLLETRLRAFVPAVMAVVRWVVIAAVVILIGEAWSLLDFAGWIASDEGLNVIGSVISAAVIVLAAMVLHVVVASWVEYRLNVNAGKVPSAREKTLLNLFKNAFTIALVVFGLMLALAQIGVNIAPLLAGAGVIGLAIGFGAQKLVEDIITGIFIQFENIMNEGDVVEAGGKSGVVEKLTIRSVTIRDMSGTVHLIPFSSVAQVSNMVRGFSFYVSEVEIAYDSDIEGAKQAMRDAFALVMEQPDYRDVILDDLDLQGLIAITPASVSLRSRIKTLAGQQWGAGRFYSETLMRLFAERGIETPTPRVSYVPGGEGRSYTQLPPLGEEPA